MEIEKRDEEYAKTIRGEYAARERTKLDELRALDAKVKRPANIFAYAFGVVAALVLGVGMCLAMKVLGDMFALGVVVGCVGIAMCTANYFIYKAILASRKRKYGARILELSDNIISNS